MSFERRLFYYFENLKHQLRTQPLILGGVSVSGGGSGSPPGGFIGMLPQSRVTFDYLEDTTTNEIPPSGASLLDNLNRIRYDIANISGGGSASNFLDLTDSPSSYTGHAGKSVVVNTGEDGVEFTLVSGGGGTDVNAIHDNVSGEINIISEKTTVVDADLILIEDSESSYTKKKVTVANLLTGISGGGSSTFLGLTDSPTTYSGQALKVPRVNSGESALEFVTVSGIYAIESMTNVYAYLGTNQINIANAADVDVALDTELYDALGEFNTSTGVFTASENGYYQVNYSARLLTINGVATTVRVTVHKNAGGGYTEVLLTEGFGDPGDNISASGSGELELDTGDLLKLTVTHSSGQATEDIQGHVAATYLNIYRLLHVSGEDDDAIHDNVSEEISAISEKTTVVDADLILIEDSESSYIKKKIQIGNLPTTSGGGSSTFLGLTDSPSSYSGQAGLVPAVNSGETALEFVGVVMSSLADTTNDFLVASGNNVFVKKTLAETGIILETVINHDNLQGVIVNEHIDHTGITLTAGTGLSGGGTIADNRTFNVDDDYVKNVGDQIDGNLIIDNTATKALLIRKDADGGDFLAINTAIGRADITQIADGNAFRIYGYDNQSAEFLSIFLNSQGNVYLVSSKHTIISPVAGGVILDGTSTESFLVRKDGDAGDVFIVDTTNDEIELRAYSKLYQPADDEGLIIYGFDDKSTDYVKMYIDASGNTIITSKNNISLIGEASANINIAAGSDADVEIKLGSDDTYQDITISNYSGAALVSIDGAGTLFAYGNVEIQGNLIVGTAPNYTISNVSTDRVLDANSTTIDEVADVLGTLIEDLIAIGLLQ